ncbi:MAG: CDF family Co(II)/Ni(II) efflux transporter DmeF [Vibrio sp.]
MKIPDCKKIETFSYFNAENEKKTRYVLALTFVMMVLEIGAGSIYGSMALLADGWHMGIHAAAFCITLFTYRYARKHQYSGKYSYGTGKVGVLGGYTSALVLGIVALGMALESVDRFVNPVAIEFNEAIFVAVLGLIVNALSMVLLQDHDHHHHGHEHEHEHEHDHQHGHHDHNLKAAYIHVLTDALTSILAIGALIMGKYVGWIWLDPMMGVIGSIVISKWAWGLMKQTAPVLLDQAIESQYEVNIVDVLESEGVAIKDIHIWKVSADHFCATLVLQDAQARQPAYFKQRLQEFDKIEHLVVEVNPS